MFDRKNVVVRSGHGIGKSYVTAAVILTFLITKWPSKVISTAPTFRQVADILWKEIREIYWNSRLPSTVGGRMLTLRYELGENHFAVGFHPRENRLTDFQGFHSEHILLVLDESPGVSKALYDAGMTLLTSENSYCLQIGNPTSRSGHFWQAFNGNKYYKVHISCFDSPNITGECNIPALVTSKWIKERGEDWGEDSVLYKTKVLGEFPGEDAERGIPLSWLEEAGLRL